MSISEIFNVEPSVADFLCPYWAVDYCDPEVWTHPVSTFGIDGVVLGEKRMTLWTETTPTSENRARKYGTNPTVVDGIVDDIEQNGIDTKCAVGYVDAETGERIGTNHRYQASQRLNIPGWMIQHVDFSNCENPEWSRELFSRAINNERSIRYNNNSVEDVEQLIIYGIENNTITSDQQVEETIKMVSNNSFSKHMQTKLMRKMNLLLHRGGGDKSGLERYVLIDESQFQDIVEKNPREDVYVDNVIKNDHEYHLFINYPNWGSRTNSVITRGAEAARKNAPLHTTTSVGKPSRVESLQTKREKVFDTGFKNVEDDLDALFTYKFKNGYFPWRHPECQHTMIGQDAHKDELDKFIPWKI